MLVHFGFSQNHHIVLPEKMLNEHFFYINYHLGSIQISVSGVASDHGIQDVWGKALAGLYDINIRDASNQEDQL